MLKVSNIRTPVGVADDDVKTYIARSLRVPGDAVRSYRILRKALDVRDRSRLEHVFTAAVEVDDEGSVLRKRRSANVAAFVPTNFSWPDPGELQLRHRPIIVGAGPAGLFAALFLARHGYQPLLLERGREVSERIPDVKAFDAGGPLDPESNYLFGEGGAGTFSDGKLTCRTSGPDADEALRVFASSKGKPSVVYEAKPHLGSNRLPAVVKSLRRQIVDAGGEIRFGVRVVDLQIESGRLSHVVTESDAIAAEAVVLAVGHSARDVYRMLERRGVPMSAKPFQLGVRIEQPQSNVTKAQYGTPALESILGPADYAMKVRAGSADLFTFCMCAGGYVMPSVSQAGFFCTNGMSRSKHESPFANSGLVTTIDPTTLGAEFGSDALAGMRFQEELERRAYELGGGDYLAPIQWANDFLNQKPSTGCPTTHPRGAVTTNFWDWLPTSLCEPLARGLPMMDHRWNGLFLKDATLVGPEARGSSPIRIDRRPTTMQSPAVDGLYPVGEGAGFAGGIVSAAIDGIKVARALAGRFAPLAR
jgi:uncharacterized FAD-dependent dehydrogenase